MPKKIAIVLGTRPEIIKMSPVIRACQKRGKDFFVLHTGQHYSPELDEQIFRDLDLPKPHYNLGVGSQPYRKQVGLMTREIGNVLLQEKPDVLIVQGDTISVLAGALAANKLGIKLAHHEAGLRSHDLSMPEETNRVITDHISDYLFAPTATAVSNLHEEGRHPDRIHLVGNTIVDAVLQNLALAEKKARKFSELELSPGAYFLASAHRAENVDVSERLLGIMKGLEQVSLAHDLPVIFSLHPRTKAKLAEFNVTVSPRIKLIDPVGFLDLLLLEKNARLVLTDSGGLQEEAFILGVPCVTMRDNTERPETVEVGGNIIAGATPEGILAAARQMMTKEMADLAHHRPFGDGRAGERILEILEQTL